MIPNNANQYLPGTVFIPSSLLIVGITNSFQMIVSVEVNEYTASNSYQNGQLVKLFVPINYGMYQANGLIGEITNVNGNDITLNIDSTNFDVFSIPSFSSGETPASLSPAGSRNLQYNNFTNSVAFQPLNNRGN